jgi:predicted nucleic acid-binding protein
MIVVSDTTAVSNLLTVGRADLLVSLFQRVLIPPAVWAELLVFHSDLPD